MIGNVLLPALGWWLALSALGWAAFPVTWRLLKVLPDRGLALSRPVGLLLAGYAFWIAVSAGLLPNSPAGAWTVVIGLAVLAAGLLRTQGGEMRAFLRSRRRLVIGYEALFLLTLVGWAIYRAYTPNIEPESAPSELRFDAKLSYPRTTLCVPRAAVAR